MLASNIAIVFKIAPQNYRNKIFLVPSFYFSTKLYDLANLRFLIPNMTKVLSNICLKTPKQAIFGRKVNDFCFWMNFFFRSFQKYSTKIHKKAFWFLVWIFLFCKKFLHIEISETADLKLSKITAQKYPHILSPKLRFFLFTWNFFHKLNFTS